MAGEAKEDEVAKNLANDWFVQALLDILEVQWKTEKCATCGNNVQICAKCEKIAVLLRRTGRL